MYKSAKFGLVLTVTYLHLLNPSPPKAPTQTPKGSPQKGKDQAPVSSPVENQYHIIVLLPVPYGQGNA